MAEESRGGRGDGRNRRRRYFKRKSDGAANTSETPRERPTPAASNESKRAEPSREARLEPKASRDEGQGGSARSRNLRKRRRSRSRRPDAQTQRNTTLPGEREEEYIPPQTVYIYEHVVRPAAGSYEFRSESFSRAGRTLDDYALDLSLIFNPPEREPVGRIIARVFAEYEAADALEAPHTDQPALPEDTESVTPPGSTSTRPSRTPGTAADKPSRQNRDRS